jgi:indolepyruvate ferredoxin oxidoreductase alpha subunit
VEVNIEALVRACGIKNVLTIDPNDLAAVKHALDWALNMDEPSAIITRWPCVLKKLSKQDKEEFSNVFATKCQVNTDKCVGCKLCLKTGCPAISFDKENKKAVINRDSCVGCEVCLQVCPTKAIGKVGE